MIQGTIRQRMLVNALVDPDEAAARLPAGLRPHVTGDQTVVGCCLVDLEQVRPAGVPAVVGSRFRAVAHRIAVEWDVPGGAVPGGAVAGGAVPGGAVAVGVFVPVRYASSRAAAAVGGRWFPGVHQRAAIRVGGARDQLGWSITAEPEQTVIVQVQVSVTGSPPAAVCEAVGGTCLGATIGLSPDRHGALEAVRMEPAHRQAQLVTIQALESQFLAGFASASPAPSYLMRDVAVTWRSVPVTIGAAAGAVR